MLNYEAPQSHAIYLHRVGRTARAGLSGRACTLVAESDRKIVRQIVRAAKAQGAGSGSGTAKVVSRVVDPNALDQYDRRMAALADEIDAILHMEKEERAMREAERDVQRGENLVGFGDEIASRPRRTWFAGERDKKQARERGAKELNGAGSGDPAATKKKNGVGKMSGKKKKRLDDRKVRKGESGRDEGEGKMWKKPKNHNDNGNSQNGRKKTKEGKRGPKGRAVSGPRQDKKNFKARPARR